LVENSVVTLLLPMLSLETHSAVSLAWRSW